MKNLIFVPCILLTMFFIGCEESSIDELGQLSESAKNHADMNSEFNSIFEYVNSVGTEDVNLSGKLQYAILTDCATAVLDAPSGVLEIDFGKDGCTCRDGLSRKGVIRAVFDGYYRDEASSVIITVTNYSVSDIPMSGTILITNLGNQSGNYQYSYVVQDAFAEFPFATISWDTEVIIERIEGDNTTTLWDDVFEISGTSHGVNGYGKTYDVETIIPLVKVNEINCLRNFVSGKLMLTDADGSTVLLDYDPIGAAVCDKTAELTINDGQPFIINLR